MAWRTRIPAQLRARLDELDISAIAEYLSRRADATDGKHELRFEIRDGRYDRGFVDGVPLSAWMRARSRGTPAGHPTRTEPR